MTTRASAAVLLAGVVAALVNWSLMTAYPDHWGGPNVAAGLLQLGCYALALAGVVLVVVSRRRQE